MFLRHLLPAFSWAVFISLLCLTPGKSMPGEPFISFDKLAHAIVFGLLSFWLTVGLRKQTLFRKHRIFAPWLALLYSILYGGVLELFQEFFLTDRHADWNDLLADSVGSGLGVVVFFVIYGKAAHYVALSHYRPPMDKIQ
jgi:VanZ family protein